MDIFNKEDLEFLKHAVREHYKNNPPTKGSTYINIWANMINKLQSMIDNECIHELSTYKAGMTCVAYCNKCNTMI